jgi:predicted ATPase/DNA-binding winged helix-turn-helix (wHTH) protein
VTSTTSGGDGEISFGCFHLDLRRRELSHRGRPVLLRRRLLDILCALASTNGELVSKDELMERVWPGRAVEEGNLFVHMSALRRALDENGDGHSYVVTVPGRGYRLAGLGSFDLIGLDRLTSEKLPSSQHHGAGSDGAVADDPGSGDSQPERAPVLERRQLTVVSCEVVGATQLAARLDPEDLTVMLSAVHHCCSEIVTRFGGSITQLSGGAMLGHFGYPQAGEHDAEQAIEAALALVGGVRHFEAAGNALQLRLGIATGPVVLRDLFEQGCAETGGLIGETVNIAEALQRTGEPSTVMIADSTRRLVGDLFDVLRRDVRLEGFDEPVESYQIIRASGVASRFQALRGLPLTPLIGRDEEIELLLRRWQQAKSSQLRVVLITGEPGIGKSRLCVEIQERIGREPHTCLRYFCSPHHQDTAFYPVIRQVEAAGGFERGDTSDVKLTKLRGLLAREISASEQNIDLLAGMLSLAAQRGSPSVEFTARRRKELTFEVLIRQIEALSLRHPVLIVFEDAHWSDPTTLELLDLLLRRGMQRPILVLVTFRPEFESSWAGQSQVTTLTVSRLDRRDGTALVRQVVGNDTLTNNVVEAIVERTDGVPLFIEELSKAVVESDSTVDAISGAQRPIRIPTTLQASLMARLDRLPYGKHVAQVGAVIGRDFPHALLAEVCNVPEAQLVAGLRELVSAGLVNAHAITPEATYTFKHVLVQDTAYESLLRSRRVAAHAAVVAACEKSPDISVEPGVLAHHCVQAGLIAKAASYYRTAAERSIGRAAITETRMHLQRGLAFAANLPEGLERDALEAELMLALAIVLQTTENMANAEAAQLLRRAADVSRNSARPQLLSRVLWGQFTSVLVRGEVLAARALADQLLKLARASDEVSMQTTARAAMGIALFYQGHFDNARKNLSIQQAILGSQLEDAHQDWRTTTAGPAFLALTLACLGYPEQAASQLDRAVELASRKGSFALAYSLSISVRVLIVLRNEQGLRAHAVQLIALSEEGGFDQFRNQGLCALGWLDARTSASQQGLDRLRNGLARSLDRSVLLGLPFYRGLLVDAQSENERPDCIAMLDDALDLCRRTGDTWFTAELHRKRGEVLAGLSFDSALAETEFHRALVIAREQSANLFELRAAMSLARLYASQGKRDEAHHFLAPVYDSFTEGFGAPDLQEARLVLDELANSTRRNPRRAY